MRSLREVKLLVIVWVMGRHGSSQGFLGMYSCCAYTYLVGGLEHEIYFSILGIIIPTDFHIFQRG